MEDLKQKMFTYFVAYNYPGGHAMTEITRPKKVEDYDDVLEMASSIEKNNPKLKTVIISNFIELDKPSANMLAKIKAKKICPNKDENGSCSLHNLHCAYPKCEN